jgi:hypothetical protein
LFRLKKIQGKKKKNLEQKEIDKKARAAENAESKNFSAKEITFAVEKMEAERKDIFHQTKGEDADAPIIF